jgi:protocatechuate 3,4-dioxygenase beta subunit
MTALNTSLLALLLTITAASSAELQAQSLEPNAQGLEPKAQVLVADAAQVISIQQFPATPGFPAPRRDSPLKVGTARIRGRVVAADTGEPLRKAQVRAMSPELRESRLATTDREGLYEVAELPAGRYQLMASKGSFVQLQYGQTRPFEPGKPLEIADGQTIEHVDFGLPRGAVITGRVVDEFGEPVSDVMVAVSRYQFMQGRRQLMPAGRFGTTNDIGEYRIFGLPPGQYYLSATLRTSAPLDVTATGDRTGYAATYYPGTSNPSEAQRISVELGQLHSGIDVTLAPARLARISGSVFDADGKPVTSGILMLMQTNGGGFFTGGSAGQIKPDATFTIVNVAPGEYVLRVMGGPGFPGPGSGAAESISANVTVAGDDINGLRVTGVRASTVTGRIILPQAGSNAIRPSSIQLITVSAQFTPIMNGGVGGGRVEDDLSFTLKVEPGHHFIRLGQAQDLMLKAVRVNGEDVTDSGIVFRPNEDVGGVEVEVTTQHSELSGTVSDARGQVAKDYSVVVFSRDARRWTTASRYFGGGRPDQDGRFKVRDLPPGDYYAIALDYVEPGSGTDPEFLERIRGRATEFSLNEGQVRALDLKLLSTP